MVPGLSLHPEKAQAIVSFFGVPHFKPELSIPGLTISLYTFILELVSRRSK